LVITLQERQEHVLGSDEIVPEGDRLDLSGSEQLGDDRRNGLRRLAFGPAPPGEQRHGRRRAIRRPSPCFLCTACLLTPSAAAMRSHCQPCSRARATWSRSSVSSSERSEATAAR